MHNISLKIIQNEKKITVITYAYMYMNNTIVKHHYSVHRTVIYIIHDLCSITFSSVQVRKWLKTSDWEMTG